VIKLPVSYSEAVMIETVGHWLDLVDKLVNKEASHQYTLVLLKRLIRQGVVQTDRVIEWAETGAALPDRALREVAAEMLEHGQKPPASITSHVTKSLLRAPKKRRGRFDEADNWLRDQCYATIIAMAQETWLIDYTRNSASDGPSACSVLSAALAARGITLKERRLAQIFERYREFLFLHRNWRTFIDRQLDEMDGRLADPRDQIDTLAR
jgi:hypothetical protein